MLLCEQSMIHILREMSKFRSKKNIIIIVIR